MVGNIYVVIRMGLKKKLGTFSPQLRVEKDFSSQGNYALLLGKNCCMIKDVREVRT